MNVWMRGVFEMDELEKVAYEFMDVPRKIG